MKCTKCGHEQAEPCTTTKDYVKKSIAKAASAPRTKIRDEIASIEYKAKGEGWTPQRQLHDAEKNAIELLARNPVLTDFEKSFLETMTTKGFRFGISAKQHGVLHGMLDKRCQGWDKDATTVQESGSKVTVEFDEFTPLPF